MTMRYPFILYSPSVRLQPIFKNLEGAPFFIDLSVANPMVAEMDPRDQIGLQRHIDERMAPDHAWGFSDYLERRDSLLRDCPQMVESRRFFHLGLDIIAPLGAPLHAPLDATVIESGYEAGEGNYGGYVLLAHEIPGCETFHSFYGHLSHDGLPPARRKVTAGEPFAAIGDFSENGNWFYHTHLQIITERGLAEGYAAKGYCAESDLARIRDLCPPPYPLFTARSL